MKRHLLILSGLAASIAACGERPPAAPPESPAPGAPVAEAPDWRDAAFVAHMHAHAEQLYKLTDALDAGDFDGAMTPAYWLSRHKTMGGIPDDLQPHVVNMREAALAVENAADLDAARAATGRVVTACQDCHAAAGVDVEI